jgi:3-deoxy-D-manno-octulosonic-acid transferase
MVLLYNLSIGLLAFLVRLASYLNSKARAFVQGRKKVMEKIQSALNPNTAPLVWIHCASVGEFEQARPIIEAIKAESPVHKIFLTFFSSSGFELRKDYPLADFVHYLPWDTARNARKLVQAARPVLAIFIKYEFWYHYTDALKKRKIPTLSVSSIFRHDQVFFHWPGRFFRRILRNFTYFFVQNQESVKLLRSIGIEHCSQAGDTRFDRVNRLLQQQSPIPVAAAFKNNQKLMVIGSCWPEDTEVLIPFINENKLKFIVAPHEITESFISDFERSLQVKSIRYSNAAGKNLDEYSVLIIDNMGMLNRLYRYGEFAFIGGAYGKGLHNTLEAACYGIPVLFGDRNFEKFQEAVDLINRGGAFAVRDYPDLKEKYEMLNVPESFLLACEVTRQYVDENIGATEKIMNYCREVLKNSNVPNA